MTSLGTSASAAAPDATSPLLSQRVYDDETVIIHKLEGRPTLPLPIVIAHRLQLYFASESANESKGDKLIGLLDQNVELKVC
jgi:hypothetical protein